MPGIHVMNAGPSDKETKRQLIAELTQTYAKVMSIRPDTIRVIVQQLPRDSWGVTGVTPEESSERVHSLTRCEV